MSLEHEQPSRILDALLTSDTALYGDLLLIIRQYLIAQRLTPFIEFGNILSCELTRCTLCPFYRSDHVISKILECGIYDAFVTTVSDRNMLYIIRFNDEEYANRLGFSLHTPSIECPHNCPLCKSIKSNYYFTFKQLKEKNMYWTKQDLVKKVCPYDLFTKWSWMDNLDMGLQAYIDVCSADKGLTNSYHDKAMMHLDRYWESYKYNSFWYPTKCCCICHHAEKTDLYKVGSYYVCNRITNKQTLPCWKYLWMSHKILKE
jgi:hypothetical protein